MRPLTAVLALLVVGCACTDPLRCDVAAPDTLAERFEVLVFFNEQGEERPLTRWASDVTVQIIGDRWERDGHLDHLRTVLADLEAATGRHIDLVDRNGQLRIWLTDFDQFEREAAVPEYRNDHDCRVKIVNHTGGTAWAMAHIQPDLSVQHTRWCMAQEIAHTFGPVNDITDPHGTVFSSQSRLDRLSETDRQILAILYDRRLWHGMSREIAMPIVREIVAEMGAAQEAASQ